MIPISAESPAEGRKLVKGLGITSFELYSDSTPEGSASRAFGMWDARFHMSQLGVVVVKAGKVVKRFHGDQDASTLLRAAR